MLVLSRKRGERVHIGDNISVTVLDYGNGKVRLGFSAPSDVLILRDGVTDTGNRPGRDSDQASKP